MTEETVNFQLIVLPEDAEQSEFDDFINFRLAFCLKNSFDNVLIDLSRVESFQRSHLTIITRWLRNLQSLGGNLAVVGVNDDMLKLFRSAKVSGICEILPTLDEFKMNHPDFQINDITDLSEGPESAVPEAESMEEEEFSLANPEEDILNNKDLSAEVQEEEIRESEEIPVESPEEETIIKEEAADKSLEMEPLDQEEFTAGSPEHEYEEINEHEGSITEAINIQKLAQMSSEGDVSDQLSFIKGSSSPKTDAPEEEISEEPAAEENNMELPEIEVEEPDAENADGVSDILDAPQVEEVSPAEAVPVEDASLVEEEGAVVQETAESLPEAGGSIDGLMQELENVIEEIDVPDPEIEVTKEASDAVIENTSRVSDEPEIEIRESKTGFISAVVEMSGEYECLSCGQAEYFLKGGSFSACDNKDCTDTNKGWDPGIILF